MPASSPSWVQVDLAAVRANVRTLVAVAPTAALCAVVKANAYGHGLAPVARAAVAAGASWLGVVSEAEALALRDAHVTNPILVLGVTESANWPALAAASVRVTIATAEQLAALAQYRGPKLAIHLKIETGLGRLGFDPRDIPSIVHTVRQLPSVTLEGMSSHLASVEEQDLAFARQQLRIFREATDHSGDGIMRHIAATAALLQLPESHLDLVRSGIGVYGLWPSDDVRTAVGRFHPSVKLQPALSWRARLIQVKAGTSGTSVGYGRTHHLDRDTRIGVISVGYADGYDRKLSNRAQVLIRGCRVPVIGRVAMNMCTVDLSSVPQVKVGEVVTLIGRDGSKEITADDLATWAETINYEVVARIPEHVSRRYMSENREP